MRNHKRPIDKKRRTTANIVSNAKEINVEDTGDVPGVTIDQNLLERTLKELKKESIKNKPSKVCYVQSAYHDQCMIIDNVISI